MNRQSNVLTLDELRPILDSVVDDASKALVGWTNRRWTREIMNRLHVLATANGCDVCASNCADAKWGGWLYDMVWLRWSTGDEGGIEVRDSPFVGECEWNKGISAIREDFQKLLLARADTRLMIFDARTEARAENVRNELIQQVASYARSEPGDRYVFASFVSATRRFACWEYVHAGATTSATLSPT